MDAETFELARASMRRVLEEADGRPLNARLQDQAWHQLLVEEEELAVASLFEAQGLAASPAGALDALILTLLGQPADASSHRAVVYPSPWGREDAAAGPASEAGWSVDGMVIGPAAGVTELLLPTTDRRMGVGALIVRADTTALKRRAATRWDETYPVTLLSGDIDSDQASWIAIDWHAAMRSARRALTCELIGLAQSMLAMAVSHVSQREQFGRAIGSFQAVRHALAEVHVAIEGSRALVSSAFRVDTDIAAMAAKAHSGITALLAIRNTQQVCGAMGWTWEFQLHRFVRRALLLDNLLGSAQTLNARVGGELLRLRRIPRIDACDFAN